MVALYAVADALGNVVEGFVADCDVDARNGLGLITFTKDQRRAKTFPSFMEAMEYWRKPSNVRPFRDDGRPNRPLTAYTVEFVNL